MGEKEDKTPQSSGANKAEVHQQNKKTNAQANNLSSAPIDGSNHDGIKKDAEDYKTHNEKHDIGDANHKKASIRSQSTFSWKNVGSWDHETIQDKSVVLKLVKNVETYIIDHLYGDWYWNTSILIGTCFFAWLAGRLGGGLLALGLVLLFTQSVYRQELRRFNRNIRDDMTRIYATNRLENELETMEWMNSFLAKFWVIYMPALSEQVLFQANEVMKDLAPGFGIEKLSLDEFTLGSKAPRVDSIKSYTRKGHDQIEMDWAFSFAPNDTDDMTKNEIKKKINPKVKLGVTIGKAFISKSLPILVEDQTFKGRMNIKLKLTENFPHVKTVAIQFLEAPTIDYALKPVGGDTLGIDIMSFIPGLSTIVNGLIHGTLRPMFYAPNSFVIDVEELMAGMNNDSIGCVAVTVKRCTNLKLVGTGKKTEPNSLNPYVQLKVENNADIDERTKTKKLINDPIFMETKYVLLNKLDGNHLNFNVYNLIADKPDDQLIGTVQFPLADLLQDEMQTGVVKKIFESGKVVGEIEFDLRYFAALNPKVLEDGTKVENTDIDVGILKLNLHEARDLDISGSVVGLLSPYAEIYINNELVKSCRRLKLTNEPSWEQSLESLITAKSKTSIQVLVKDAANDNVVGKLNTNLQDIIFESGRGQQWIKQPSVKSEGPKSSFRISAQWKALGMENETAGAFLESSIGGLRVHIRSASDLKNLESVGKVDPYIRCIMDGTLRAKTNTISNTVDPNFNSVFFFPVSNPHQHILLGIMDEEAGSHDRPLGSCAINVFDFLKKSTDGNYLGYDGSNEVIEQPIIYNGDKHGYLSYSVSFIPTIPVYTKNQVDNMDKYLAHKAKLAKDEEEQFIADEKKFKEHPKEYEWVELDDQDNVPEPAKHEIPLEQSIKYRSGNILVNLISGQFNKPDIYVHVLFDDHAYPSGVSSKSSDRTLNVHSISEAFIRDLPNSKIILRLGKKVEINSEKDVLVEKSFDTLDILKRSYDKPIRLSLDRNNSVKVQLEYFPSTVKLPPMDTILDVGRINLDILGADNLQSVDSNGKLDPLCVVKLDGVEIFKTDKKRRTLDPVWNEAVEFPIQSRSRLIILLEVYDWDLTHDDELLGRTVLDLSTIDPYESQQFKVDLDTQGTIALRATFKPEYIRPKLNSSSGLQLDMNDITGVPMALGGAAIGGATSVVGGGVGVASNVVGGGVGLASDTVTKGGSFLKGFGKGKKSDKKGKSADGTAKETGDHKDHEDDDNDLSMADLASQDSPSKKSTAGNAGNDLQSLRSGATHQTVNAAPNMNPDLLPPPQRPNVLHHANGGHSRTPSLVTQASSFIGGAANADGTIPGRVNVISGSGFSNNACDVKVFLKSGEKEKDLIKTRQTKADKTGLFHWNESIPFKSTSDATIVFSVREKHTFGKNVELASASIPLSDALNNAEDVHLDVGQGKLTVNVRFITLNH